MAIGLKKTVSPINYLPIDHPRLGEKFVRTRWTLRVDVQNFMAERHEPIGNDHAMAAKIHALGAHISDARGARKVGQFSDSLSNSGVSV